MHGRQVIKYDSRRLMRPDTTVLLDTPSIIRRNIFSEMTIQLHSHSGGVNLWRCAKLNTKVLLLITRVPLIENSRLKYFANTNCSRREEHMVEATVRQCSFSDKRNKMKWDEIDVLNTFRKL